MTRHLTEEEINDLIDRRLTVPKEIEARGHVGSCSECATSVDRISIIVSSAPEVRIAVIPESDLWPRIAGRTIHLRSRRINPRLYALIVAVAVLAVVIAWNLVSRHRAADSRPAMAAAWRVNSDGDRMRALRDALPLVASDQRENAWIDFFKVVSTIKSDAERRKVLLDAAKYARGEPDVAIMIIYAAAPMQSPANKADVLVALAHADAAEFDKVRDIYFRIANAMPPGSDRKRAIEAVPPD